MTAQDANGRQEKDLEQADSLLAPNLAPESQMDTTPAGQAGASEPAHAEADKARLAVIADLLCQLPETKRRDLIEELPPVEQERIARLLIERSQQERHT